MQKTIVVAILVLLMAVSGGSLAQETQTIGLLVPSDDMQYFEAVIASAQSAADEAGYELVVLGSAEDAEVEAANMASLLEQGVAAVLLYPVSVTGSSAAVVAANEAGVPVVMLGLAVAPMEAEDGAMTDAIAASVVLAEPATAAISVAEFFCDETGDMGTLYVLTGSDVDIPYTAEDAEEETSVVAARLAGMDGYFGETCDEVEVIVQDTEEAGNDAALAYLEGLFEAEEDVNGVVAMNADLALASAEAARAARARGLVLATFDISDEVLGNIESGRISVVVVPDAAELGATGVTNASSALMGEVDSVSFVAPVSISAINFEAFRVCRNPNGCG